MVKTHVKGKNWRDPLVHPSAEEAATILQNNGLKMSGVEKMVTEYKERMHYTPDTIFASPAPKEAWVQIAERIQKEKAKFATDSKTYEDACIALYTAQNMEHGTSVWDALVLQLEICEENYGASRREAQYILRHNAYIVMESYAGRIVG